MENFFSQKNYQARSNQTSNPFDAVMMMFKEVPLININTKNIDIQIPIISSEDITKYKAYLIGRYETNIKTLEKRLNTVNGVLAFCGRVSKEDAPGMIADLQKEKAAINADTELDKNTKA
ncbi:hypothetical protein KKG31_07815 [Patescibacteria group bacterium]|nr:hypothetical protein [Patescibacteria group bacterium]MBU1758972.1 hypothetical protein [Patescibacteria group bacterium]